MDLNDNWRFSKSRKLVEQEFPGYHSSSTGKSHRTGSFPPMRSRNKPWPSTKGDRDEELVKYMSNVPSYLQRADRGKFQDKALNVGVLQWKHLEKWRSKNNKELRKEHGNSHSSSSRSSPISTLASPLKSCGSTSSSQPETERRKLSSLSSSQSAFAQGCKTLMEVQKASRQLREKYKKVGDDISHQKASSCYASQPSDSGVSTLMDYGCTSLPSKLNEKEDGKLEFEGEPQSPEMQDCVVDPRNEDRFQDQFQATGKSSEVSWEENAPGRCSSFESTGYRDGHLGDIQQSFLTHILHKDDKFSGQSVQFPTSGPLPPVIITAGEIIMMKVPCSKFGVPTTYHGKHEKLGAPNDKADDLYGICNNDQVDTGKKASSRTERGPSPDQQVIISLNHFNRTSSIRDGSPKGQMRRFKYADNSPGDKARVNRKGRQSPLRRILEPLLKPITHSRPCSPVTETHFQQSGHTVKSPIRDDIISTQGPWKSTGSESQMRQALLQLSWKNGQPLYMVSFNDNDILVAAVKKKNELVKDQPECIYTIFSVQEVKKKSASWMNQGTKSKEGLVSAVVGHMKVSCRRQVVYDCKSTSVVRECVLFGSEPGLSPCDSTGNRSCIELAAVIVKDENVQQASCERGVLQSNSQEDSPDQCLNSECSTSSSILAIIPSGVHGFSLNGKPTPLIQRWKSGGSCDCGGWDEGCRLRVLTDTQQEGKCYSPFRAYDATHRIDLLLQGGPQEKEHAFSMVASRESLYTVEFGSSIGLIQAFGICIAILHSRKFPVLPGSHFSLERQTLQDHFFADGTQSFDPKVHEVEAPASYVPTTPPLSRYGRA